MTIHVAVSGTRHLSAAEAHWWTALGMALARRGCIVHCGGAPGVDQAVGRGVLAVAPARFVLHLPWPTFEHAVLDPWVAAGASVDLPPFTPDARALAAAVHPRWPVLRPAAQALLTRNVRLLQPPVVRLIARPQWAKPGGGGTGHTLRAACALGLTVDDVTRPEVATRYARWLRTPWPGSAGPQGSRE